MRNTAGDTLLTINPKMLPKAMSGYAIIAIFVLTIGNLVIGSVF
jgi:hypothetical protein